MAKHWYDSQLTGLVILPFALTPAQGQDNFYTGKNRPHHRRRHRRRRLRHLRAHHRAAHGKHVAGNRRSLSTTCRGGFFHTRQTICTRSPARC